MASIIGMIIGLMSFIFGIFLIIQKILFDDIAAGWTSTVVSTIFLFGLNFFFLGVIGEYLGRIYLETKGRPNYIISSIIEKDKSIES